MDTTEKQKLTPEIFFVEKIPVVISDFIISGFTGWIYETVITSIYLREFVDRGVLPIPILPIYGLFSLILPFIFKRKHNPFFILLASAAGATVFELAGAYLTEAILHEQLWTYEHWPLNFFGGRVSVISSLIFGILCIVYVKGVHPFSQFLCRKLGKAFTIGTYALAGILIALCSFAWQ